MTRVECSREQETLDALAARRLPVRAEPELLSHVAACDICRDLVVVIAALQDVAEEDASSAPSAATVWWRAQLRAHREAARKAAAPIRVAQVAAVIVALVALAAFQSVLPSWSPGLPFDRDAVTAWWPSLPSLSWPSIPWTSFDDLPPFTLASIREMSGWSWLALVLLLWVAVAPIAVYLAGVED